MVFTAHKHGDDLGILYHWVYHIAGDRIETSDFTQWMGSTNFHLRVHLVSS